MKGTHRLGWVLWVFTWAGALPATAGEGNSFDVLVFSKTAGFRHPSIVDGLAMIESLGQEGGFGVTATEDATRFNPTDLALFRVVVFLSTSRNVLDATQEAAFETYIQGGGGYVGIHAAADTEYAWEWYGRLLGNDAWFLNHPEIQTATVIVADDEHPSTAHLPLTFSMEDEWYNFRNNPRPEVRVLLSLDETTYTGGSMGIDHPIAWCHQFDGGRSWYTGLGHRPETYQDPRFIDHVRGGIRWAAGGGPTAPVPALEGAGWVSLLLLMLVWGGIRLAVPRR